MHFLSKVINVINIVVNKEYIYISTCIWKFFLFIIIFFFKSKLIFWKRFLGRKLIARHIKCISECSCPNNFQWFFKVFNISKLQYNKDIFLVCFLKNKSSHCRKVNFYIEWRCSRFTFVIVIVIYPQVSSKNNWLSWFFVHTFITIFVPSSSVFDSMHTLAYILSLHASSGSCLFFYFNIFKKANYCIS